MDLANAWNIVKFEPSGDRRIVRMNEFFARKDWHSARNFPEKYAWKQLCCHRVNNEDLFPPFRKARITSCSLHDCDKFPAGFESTARRMVWSNSTYGNFDSDFVMSVSWTAVWTSQTFYLRFEFYQHWDSYNVVIFVGKYHKLGDSETKRMTNRSIETVRWK